MKQGEGGIAFSLSLYQMTTPNLARIERMPDLRATWPNEAQHFTPWLAENIAQLGEALGMELELQQTEAPVGGYSLDILATDVNSRRPVIIENQLETTDHSHLGQLLTYAAGFDAGVVVWVTREFRDEHRQTLDWLNQRTSEDTLFFGVEVQLWRIGDSLPAPHFNLAATPNEWRKEAVRRADAGQPGISARNEKYRDFFQSLLDTLRDDHKFTTARKAQPLGWYSFRTGYSGTGYGASFALNQRARVDLYIDSGNKEQNTYVFEGLETDQDEIHLAAGWKLDWERLEDRRACRIATYRPGSIDDDEATLAEVRAWMVDSLLKFKDVFGPRLAELTNYQN